MVKRIKSFSERLLRFEPRQRTLWNRDFLFANASSLRQALEDSIKWMKLSKGSPCLHFKYSANVLCVYWWEVHDLMSVARLWILLSHDSNTTLKIVAVEAQRGSVPMWQFSMLHFRIMLIYWQIMWDKWLEVLVAKLWKNSLSRKLIRSDLDVMQLIRQLQVNGSIKC